MELYSGEWTEIKGIIEFFLEFNDLGVDTSEIIMLFNLDRLIPATGAAAVSTVCLHGALCELAIGLTDIYMLRVYVYMYLPYIAYVYTLVLCLAHIQVFGFLSTFAFAAIAVASIMMIIVSHRKQSSSSATSKA